VHCFLGSDGVKPAELKARSKEECKKYGVTFVHGEVVHGRRSDRFASSGFHLELQDGTTLRARKVLLATGVVDVLPNIPGFDDFYGVTAHHCPYCDGWEHRHQRLVAYGRTKSVANLAVTLLGWSKAVTCCTDGMQLSTAEIDRLNKCGINHRSEKITQLAGNDGKLSEVRFDKGEFVSADALFFSAEQVQRSALPKILGCECNEDGLVERKGKQGSGIRGLFLAGDADGDVQFVIAAAAEGATAATAINAELDEDDYP
jgi:thioredoxin reductase